MAKTMIGLPPWQKLARMFQFSDYAVSKYKLEFANAKTTQGKLFSVINTNDSVL